MIQKEGTHTTLNVTINPKTLNVCTVVPFDQAKTISLQLESLLDSGLWRVFEGHSFPLL
jgi:hypothetical protein